MQAAPFHADVCLHPAAAEAFWLRTSDGVRIRIGVWRAGARGTVLLFPGRTEYIEKYTDAAAQLTARGFATVIVDWRGQGLADRLTADPMVGHVHRFRDYQRDVRAVTDAVQSLGLPQPMFLMAHSMGGCIGLRSLFDGLPVRAVAFTGPMWGIKLSRSLRPVAWVAGYGARIALRDHRYAPTTGPQTYVTAVPFQDNMLTRDPEMFAMMQRQVVAHPELALGGPSMTWLLEGLIETRSLNARRSPALPCLTALGAVERIVDQPRIRDRMARWPGGRLDEYPDAEHEIMMEIPGHRTRFYDSAAALFDANRD